MPNSTTYSPTPQNPSYSGTISSGAISTNSVSSSGTFSFNGLSSADFTIASNSWLNKPTCEISLVNSIIGIVFNSSDGVTDTKLEFAPEPNMTVSELMKIIMLVTVANTGRLGKTDALSYVRTHSLERHFKFTV